MDDVGKLRKQRGYIKGKLTRLEHTIQDQAATLDKEDAKVRLERLDQVISEFQEIQRQMVEKIDELTEADDEEEADFEERSLTVRANLRRIINETRNANTTEHGGVAHSTMHEAEEDGVLETLLRAQTEILQRLSNNSVDGAVRGSQVKLPTIELPSFDGKIEEWTHFHDAFIKTIHSNRTLPNIQKFIYLRSCVTGTASRAIEDIELSDDNYMVAWEQLRRRYEDSDVVKRKHIQCLFEMPSAEKESASSIMQLVDYVNKHTRVLKRLGAPTESWSDILSHMVESKLDRVTLRAWQERVAVSPDDENGDQQSNLDKLMDFLIQRCHTLERIESGKSKTNLSSDKGILKKQGQLRANGKNNPSKNSATEKVTSLAGSMTTGACFVCQGAHSVYKCNKFLAMSPEERNQEALKLKLCLNCLRNDHFVKSCKHGSCRECSGRHNTLLHQPIKTKQMSGTEKAEDTGMVSDTKPACHSSSTSKCSVLMATAIIDVSNQEGYCMPIRVLLDSGSEANFITQNICNNLNLKRNATSEVVSGICDSISQVRQFTNVIVKSKHMNFKVNAKCLIVPKITSDLPSDEIDKKGLSIPPNLSLADPDFDKRNSVDLLIGAEFFYDLLQNDKIELDQGKLFLQNTKLGWVVVGSISNNKRKDVNN